MNLRGKNKAGATGTEASTEALAGAGALPNSNPDSWDAAWEAHGNESTEQPQGDGVPNDPVGEDQVDPPEPPAGEEVDPPSPPPASPPAAPAPDPVAAALAQLAQAQTTTHQAIGNMADQMRQVKAEAAVAAQAAQSPGGPSQEQIAQAAKDPESWAKFKTEWADFASPIEELFDSRLKAALQAAGSVDVEKVKAELRAEMKAEREREKAEEAKAAKAQDDFNRAVAQARAAVLKARPNFDAERTSEAFKAWVVTQAPGIQDLGRSWKPDDAIALMNLWDASKPVEKTADDVHAARERKLSRSTVSPGSVVQPPRNGGNPFEGLDWHSAWDLDTKLKEQGSARR